MYYTIMMFVVAGYCQTRLWYVGGMDLFKLRNMAYMIIMIMCYIEGAFTALRLLDA